MSDKTEYVLQSVAWVALLTAIGWTVGQILALLSEEFRRSR